MATTTAWKNSKFWMLCRLFRCHQAGFSQKASKTTSWIALSLRSSTILYRRSVKTQLQMAAEPLASAPKCGHKFHFAPSPASQKKSSCENHWALLLPKALSGCYSTKLQFEPGFATCKFPCPHQRKKRFFLKKCLTQCICDQCAGAQFALLQEINLCIYRHNVGSVC